MKRLKALVPILLILATAKGAADDLVNIYELALQRDPQLQAAEAAYLAALQAKPQARSFLLPQVDFSAQTRDSDREVKSSDNPAVVPEETFDTDADSWSLVLNQSVFNWEFWVQLSQADSSVAQAEADVRFARQDVILRVAEAYFNVLGAEDNLRFRTAEKEAIARQLEQSEKRFEVGLIAITDVKESQARYDTAVAEEISAMNLLDNTREQLATITGEYHEQLSRLFEEIPLVPPDPADIDAWVDVALEQNLNLIAARFATEVAGKEVKRQRSGHLPTFDLVAQTDYVDQEGSGVFTGRETQDKSITLQANVPIYSGGRVSSLTTEARHNFQRAQDDYERVRRETIRQTRASYLDATADMSRVKALRQALVSNQTASEATEAGFEVGTRTAVDVLISLQAVYQAERDYARARYDYVLNSLRLRQAAGTLSREHVEIVNRYLD